MNGQSPRYVTALITGASAGLGAEFARQLAAEGTNLILTARRRDKLETLAAELSSRYGVAADVLTADLSRPEESQALARKLAAIGTVDLLVNNAGFGGRARFSEEEPARVEAMVQVHVVAPVLLARAALPAMTARGKGAIINVSSVAAFSSFSGTMYSSTKAFLLMFSENLKNEQRGTGIKVQALCPGLTHTEFHDAAGLNVSSIPKAFWMDAADVVSYSLQALDGNKVMVIPGLKNRIFTAVMRCPLTSWLPAAAMRLPSVRKRARM